MQDYSDHPFRDLLLHIEDKCKQLGEERDFVNYLLSMGNADSIEELVSIYNNIYKLLAYLFFKTKKFPHNWYIPETWGRYNFYYVEDLNGFLNENILKCYDRLKDPTGEQCLMFLSNLREHGNIKEIKEAIIANTPDVDSNLAIIVLFNRNLHNWSRKEIEKDSRNKTKYIKSYIKSSRCLAAYGRIFDVAEIAFGKANGVIYEGMAEQYKADVELERIKKEKEKKRRRELAKSNEMIYKAFDTVGNSLFSYLLSLPLAVLGAIFSNLGKKR